MSPANALSRLLALTEREYRNNQAVPAPRKFKGLRLNLNRLDGEWERRRGAGVRLAAILLRDDSEALQRRAGADKPAFTRALPWLRREAAQLRKSANLVDKAVSCLTAVLERHERDIASAPIQNDKTSELAAGQL